ncbi:MAG: hypothetical protein JW850_00375 [Thermoflexales bacterium]|nr:hypothetical protein [Thermoflexales bacterium]
MTHKKSISIGALLILVLLAFAASGCASKKCPVNGKWTTGEESGVTSFTVDRCAIPYVYYTITASGVQSSGTISLLDTCQIDNNQQFKCQEQGYAEPRYTFSGKFTANDVAEGQLILAKGFQGLDLTQDMTFDWKASPSQ